MILRLLVGADDRSGALETAGACADAGLVSVVTTRARAAGVPTEIEVEVVDLGTRHVSSDEAVARTVALIGPASATGTRDARYAHKIDSTLRGNWASEVVGRQRLTGERVLVVAAAPAAGRTCRGGVVHAHGRPVAEGAAGVDARRPIASSRPADLLTTAGARVVVELGGEGALAAWLHGDDAPIAVVDAETDADLDVIARGWASCDDGTILAGTGAAIGAGARALVGPRSSPGRPGVDRPALVVCGSRHPVARAQVDGLVQAGARPVRPDDPPTTALAAWQEDGIVVLTPAEQGDADADLVAHALGASAARLARAAPGWATLVLVGGDTAAVVLGDQVVVVGGTLAPGVAWGHVLGSSAPLVVAKPGGFGDAATLVRLLGGRLTP